MAYKLPASGKATEGREDASGGKELHLSKRSTRRRKGSKRRGESISPYCPSGLRKRGVRKTARAIERGRKQGTLGADTHLYVLDPRDLG